MRRTVTWALVTAWVAGLVALTGLAGPAHAAGPTVVSITFDDTYADSVPALNAMMTRGVPGTLFVNSDRVGFNANYMSRAQLKSYANAGFEIGGHTLGHVDLTTLSVADAQANICADRTNLLNLGYQAYDFAYPFGAENADIEAAVKACGYNSARAISDLKSPASCLRCSPAENIPPANSYYIRTPASVRSTFSLADVEGEVTQAYPGGGWVPLVFHHICDGCGGNSMSLADFTALMDWLKTQPVTLATVHTVMGGALQPPPGDPNPVPDDDSVQIGNATHVIDGVNAQRTTGALIEYTPARGATTGTNAFGTEVLVLNGVVNKVEVGVGNMAIPSGGVVLSGHGDASTWLKGNAKVGAPVTLHDASSPPPPPPPPPPVVPTGTVHIGTATHAITGQDTTRRTDNLIVFTPATGASTGTNAFGFEAAVVNGVVTQVADGVGDMAIPSNGYVLSGHGEARTWLRTFAKVGAQVS